MLELFQDAETFCRTSVSCSLSKSPVATAATSQAEPSVSSSTHFGRLLPLSATSLAAFGKTSARTIRVALTAAAPCFSIGSSEQVLH